MTKTLSLYIFQFAILLIGLTCSAEQVNKRPILVAISQIVDHQALNDIRRGLEDALNTKMPGEVQIRYDNANGSMATAVQIAKIQASLNPAFMVGISTPSAQSAERARDPLKTTLVAVAVTDFQAAGLDTAPNMLGVSDKPQVEQLVTTLLQILPNVKTIGAIYNASEISSVKTVERLIRTSPNITVKTATITSTSDIKIAASKLVNKVDAIYTPLDNTVYSAIDSVIAVANQAKIPVIGHDPTTINKGIFLVTGVDHYKLGVQAGDMIVDSVHGKKVTPNIQACRDGEILINATAAHTLGIEIPKELQQNLVNKVNK